MFIYCFDEEYKHILIKKGLHFIRQEIVDEKVVYLFTQNNKLSFDELDKTKVILSNVMRFDKGVETNF